MKKVNVWFDMDGTIADLYNEEGWLEALRDEKQEIFEILRPMLDIYALFADIEELADIYEVNLKIGVITWTPMEATYKYQKECEFSKAAWLGSQYVLDIDRFFAIPYGTPKQSIIKKGCKDYQILVDDNREVLKRWNTKKLRKSVNATKCLAPLGGQTYRENILEKIEKIISTIACEG